MTREDFDAIVVGSGITGGWAAKELAERGLSVLMIERGRNIEHQTDYVGEHVPPWDFRFRGKGDRLLFEEEYPIQSQIYAFGEDNLQFWANDREQPYIQDSERPFHWIRTNCLGGRSLVWGRQVYRFSDLDFEANAKDGHGVDWPIRYHDIEPWYDHVEKFIGVSGHAEGVPQLPDSIFLPPMEMTCVERFAKEQIESAFDDRVMTIGRCAVITQEHAGRAVCHYCGPCQRGCSAGSYFSTQSSTLPAARATGRVEVLTDAIVEKVTYGDRAGRATGVAIVDANTRERRQFRSRLVFLCASALGSTQILLNSTSERFPNGLANSSGVLGHYLMDHTIGAGAIGFIPGFDDEHEFGNRPNGIYIPRFRNVGDQEAEFVRGFGYQGQGLRMTWKRASFTPGFGAKLKEELRKPGPWMFLLQGFGECLPQHDNAMTLDRSRPDQWGMPQIAVRFSWGENERIMVKDMAASAVEMQKACGAVNIVPMPQLGIPGMAVHEMGTARMGRDPKTSVLNAHNQCHDVPNLFVTDGACMTSSSCVNPSLTYMALTARAASFAAEEMRKGSL